MTSAISGKEGKSGSDPLSRPSASTPTSRKTQAVVDSIFQTPITQAPLIDRLFAWVMGWDTEAEKRFEEAYSQLFDSAKSEAVNSAEIASAQPVPVESSVERWDTVLCPSILDDSGPATDPAPPVTASTLAVVTPAPTTSRPLVLGASRAAEIVRRKKLQSEVSSSESRLLFWNQSPEKKEIFTLLEEVIRTFKERRNLIANEVQKLKQQHEQYNLQQIYALYEDRILMCASVREQAEKFYRNYTAMMDNVKKLVQEKEKAQKERETLIQDYHKILTQKLSNPEERAEFEITLLIVKGQHYFANCGPKNPGSTCLEQFADNFAKDVDQALELIVGSKSLEQNLSELRKRIEKGLLRGAAMVPAARESVAKYPPNSVDEQRRTVVKRLREMINTSSDLQRKHSESLKCLDKLSQAEREKYLTHTRIQNSSTTLERINQNFKA